MRTFWLLLLKLYFWKGDWKLIFVSTNQNSRFCNISIFAKILIVKDRVKAFHDFKNKQKRLWRNVFWHVKVGIFSKFIHHSVYIEIKHKCSSYQFHCYFAICIWVEARYFFLNNCVRHFQFSISFRSYQSLYFCSTKDMDSLTLKRNNSFESWNNRKSTFAFASRPLNLQNRRFENVSFSL